MSSRKACVSASAVVREFEQRLRDRKIGVTKFSIKARIGHTTLWQWFSGRHSPTLIDFEAAAYVLGYRLVLVPISPAANGASVLSADASGQDGHADAL